jgi:hypothetical protein
MTTLLVKYKEAVTEIRALESKLYEVGKERDKLISKITSQFITRDEIYNTLPAKWMDTSSTHPISFYRINYKATDRGIAQRERHVALSFINVDAESGFVYEEGNNVGRFGYPSFTYDYSSKPQGDWWRIQNIYELVVPFGGWFVDYHPRWAKSAALMARIVSDECEEHERIDFIDKDRDVAITRIRYLESLFLGMPSLNDKYPTLHKLLKMHDWTWEYADRPDRARNQPIEDQIIQQMKLLPVDERIIMWTQNSWAPFTLGTLDSSTWKLLEV